MSAPAMSNKPTLKVLAVIEATTVIGPAKNLIEFCCRARDPHTPALPSVEVTIVTFHRNADSSSLVAEGAARGGDDSSGVGGSAPNEFVAAARAAGIEVEVIGERFRFDPRVRGHLRRIAERRAPDIIQTHQVKSHFLLKLSGLWRRYPWIAYHHGYTTTDLKMRLYNSLNRWSLPTAHRVITVCQAFAQQLTHEGVAPELIRVRHNSINTNGFASQESEERALRVRHGIAGGERVILAVGRFSPEKAQSDLVAALGHLRRAHPEINFKLLLVGDGPERLRIERVAAEQGVGEQIIFAGQVKNVRPYYALADALALPSHSEGSPNVLLEAMAADVPVVATRVGGVPEIVTHEETALLVAPRAPEEMAAALYRVLTDAPLAAELKARAAALIAARYTPEAYARSMVEIYRALLESRKALNPA